VASAAHLIIGDTTGSTPVEVSHLDIVMLEMQDGQLAHTNHFIVPHAGGITPPVSSSDSTERIARARALLSAAAASGEAPSVGAVEKMLEDEQGLPGAINRKASEKIASETLFSIVMDLTRKTASVRVGRPTECEQTVFLNPLGL